MEASDKKIRLSIGGMTCVSCQNKIERELKRTKGIVSANVSYHSGTADIVYDQGKISLKEIVAVIEKLDYKVLLKKEQQRPDVIKTVCMLAVIIFLYVLLQSTGILNFLVPSQLADAKMGYGMLFVIGLLTSVHCIAMCGGIHLSQCIPQAGQREAVNSGKPALYCPALAYNLGRVLSYTLVGFVLGLAGFLIGGVGEVGISAFLQGLLKIIAGLFMVVMGINMLGIFPWLRKFTIRVPKVLARWVGKEKAKSSRPFIVGILNGFMPCGPLQSMWIVALAAGNPFAGALSMFFFGLGTVPLMLGLGTVVSALGKKFVRQVMTVGAVSVTVLGLAMISQGGSLSGWNFRSVLTQNSPEADTQAEVTDGVQIVNSTLSPGRYPNITVQAGVPVKWVIDAPEGSINGCNYKILMRDYGIEYTFQTGENIIEFTPKQPGAIAYSCWMGMIRGNIFVLD